MRISVCIPAAHSAVSLRTKKNIVKGQSRKTNKNNHPNTQAGNFALNKASVTTKTMRVMLPHSITSFPGFRLKICQKC